MRSSTFITASARWPNLRPQEQSACYIAEAALNVTANELDVPGAPPKTPDAELIYGDGRTAAFEVMSHSADGARRLEARVGRDAYTWPTSGARSWLLQVASDGDLDQLQHCYEHVIAVCDDHGVRMPGNLPSQVVWSDPALRWLVYGSGNVLLAFDPEPNETPVVTLVLPGTGGVVNHSLDGLRAALDAAYQKPHFRKHFVKLGDSGYVERHLFVPLHYTAFSFEVMDGLQRSTTPPPSPPPARPEVTHLWLVAQFGHVAWLWSANDGWQRFPLPA